LLAGGETPYLLKHGTGRDTYFLILVPVTDDEAKQWAGVLPAAPTVIKMGTRKLMPLQLEEGVAAGCIQSQLYDASAGGWSATVSVARFK